MDTGEFVAKAEAQPSFSNIPNETLTQILHFCGYTTIINFSSTCKRYFELVSNSAGLQLHIELEANGLEIAKGSNKSNVDYPKILNELKTYRDAWLDFNTGPPTYHPVSPENNMELCEIDNDSFIGAYYHPSGQARTYPNTLQVHPLGSAPLPPMHFPLAFHGFAADLTQGLFVLIAVNPLSTTRAEIHFKSSVTGRNHLLAACPTLTVEVPFPISYILHSQLPVKIMKNILLVKFDNPKLHSYEVLLWDWQSGAFLCRVSSQSGICDASFLDDTHFIVYSASRSELGASTRWSLDLLVYTIPTSRSTLDPPPNTHVHTQLYPNTHLKLRLGLPKIADSLLVLPSGFGLKSDPLPGRTVHTSSVTFLLSHVITLKLGVTLCANPRDVTTSMHFSIYVNAAQICSDLDSGRWGDTSTAIPWNEWGPRTTRWFAERFEASDIFWPSSSCGSRYVQGHMVDGDSGLQWTVSMLDFHAPKVIQHPSRGSEPHMDTQPYIESNQTTPIDGWLDDLLPALQGSIHSATHAMFNEPLAPLGDDAFIAAFGSGITTVISNGFEEPAESRLPFEAVTKAQACPFFESWLLSGNYLIGYDCSSAEVGLYAYPLQLAPSS